MYKLLLIISLNSLFLSSYSQNQTHTTNPTTKLGEHSIIVDELGNHYNFQQWKAIEVKRNHYLSRRRENDIDIFVIKKFTEEQKEHIINSAKKPKTSPAFIEGEKFKYFNIKTLDGINLKRKDLIGKILVFNFWFINCPPCRREIPELNNLTEKYKDNKDILFIGVALDEVFKLKEFFKKQPFNYTQIRNGRTISSQENIKSYPTHLIVNKDGDITFSTQGLTVNTIHWIEKTIEEAL